jgi:hypothetical protein
VLGEGVNAGVRKRIPNHHEVIGYRPISVEIWGYFTTNLRQKMLAQPTPEVSLRR